MDEPSASFGFEDVTATEKTTRVGAVFSSVASRYDLMNDLMSGGLHRLWKRALMDRLRPHAGMRLLDVGGGTGDIALAFLAQGGREVTVCDRNPAMLARGRDRAIDQGRLGQPVWLCGDAEGLPLPDMAVDAYVTAFCLRNVSRLPLALAEARRVLRPGGRFLCLEFSHVALPLLDRLYDAYSFQVLPLLGQVVAGDRAAYQYLVESIRRFPDQAAFAGMIAAAGLERVDHRNLSGGIVALHAAWRL